MLLYICTYNPELYMLYYIISISRIGYTVKVIGAVERVYNI